MISDSLLLPNERPREVSVCVNNRPIPVKTTSTRVWILMLQALWAFCVYLKRSMIAQIPLNTTNNLSVKAK